MMSSNPVVAAKRYTDPYAINTKPLTSQSRKTLQRSISQSNHSATLSSTQSVAGSSVRRDYSRASSAASVGTNRSTSSVRSLSKEQVRERMQRPPDIPTCRGGSINVYRCSAEYLEDFWSKQKMENDARREALKKAREEHQKQIEADIARNPPQSQPSKVKPVLSASLASRVSQLRPPAKKAPSVTEPQRTATPNQNLRSNSNIVGGTPSKRPASPVAQETTRLVPPQKRAARTGSAVVPPSATRISTAGPKHSITPKAIGTTPRSASSLHRNSGTRTSSLDVSQTSSSAPKTVQSSRSASADKKTVARTASPLQKSSAISSTNRVFQGNSGRPLPSSARSNSLTDSRRTNSNCSLSTPQVGKNGSKGQKPSLKNGVVSRPTETLDKKPKS